VSGFLIRSVLVLAAEFSFDSVDQPDSPPTEGRSVSKTSCEPSSVSDMVLVGSEPGRGKKMDRLREWMRLCDRRDDGWDVSCLRGSAIPLPLLDLSISGAEKEVWI
jgi:hypothetical protein